MIAISRSEANKTIVDYCNKKLRYIYIYEVINFEFDTLMTFGYDTLLPIFKWLKWCYIPCEMTITRDRTAAT